MESKLEKTKRKLNELNVELKKLRKELLEKQREYFELTGQKAEIEQGEFSRDYFEEGEMHL